MSRNFFKSFGYLLILTIFFLGFSAMAKKPKAFPIHLKVDFGPANKPGYDDVLYVEKDETAKEAVSQVFPVLSGAACCSLRDVLAIDGVRNDPDQKRWWVALLNGSKSFSPSRKKLSPNDRLEWRYEESEGTLKKKN